MPVVPAGNSGIHMDIVEIDLFRLPDSYFCQLLLYYLTLIVIYRSEIHHSVRGSVLASDPMQIIPTDITPVSTGSDSWIVNRYQPSCP